MFRDEEQAACPAQVLLPFTDKADFLNTTFYPVVPPPVSLEVRLDINTTPVPTTEVDQYLGTDRQW